MTTWDDKQPYIDRPYEDTKYIRQLYKLAEVQTGVVVDYEKTVVPALKEGRVFLYYNSADVPTAFLQFVKAVLPDTNEHVFLERMLYSDGSSKRAPGLLIGALECLARDNELDAILAGSSLNHNEAARKLYERAGFKTNYTFRKDLT